MHNLDVILGSESHLEAAIFDAEVFSNHFCVYSKDRNLFGGGVFILISKSIPSYCLNINSDIEEIWASLRLSNVSPIILGSFYHPPYSPDLILDELSVSMSHIRSQFPSSKIVLGGDFNCPGIDWSGHILSDSYVPISLRERLIRFLDYFHLTQIVTFPTRGSNILDLCFVSHPDLVLNCDSLPGLSDHEAVLVELSTTISRGKQALRKIYLYNQANWTAKRDCVSIFSEEYFSLNQASLRSVEENWSLIHDHILQTINRHVPC